MKPCLLFSNNPVMGLKVLYCLHRAGYRVDTISLRPHNIIRYSRYRGMVYHRSLGDMAAPSVISDWIIQHAAASRYEAILGDDIFAHGLLNDMRHDLGIPVFAPSPCKLLHECADKWSFYMRAKRMGVPVPESILLEDPKTLLKFQLTQLGFPVLVKPLMAESGHGIKKCANVEEVVRYLNTPGPYKKFPLKIQRFVEGWTIGLSLLACGGKILSSDIQLHASDGARVFYEDPEVLDIGRRIVRGFGYGGPGHIDFVRDNQTRKLYALEFNPRFWYTVTASMWRGGNFPALAVKLAKNEAVPEAPTQPGRYFLPGTVVGMWKHPRMMRRVDAANWKGFFQAITDPFPHLASLLRGAGTGQVEGRRL